MDITPKPLPRSAIAHAQRLRDGMDAFFLKSLPSERLGAMDPVTLRMHLRCADAVLGARWGKTQKLDDFLERGFFLNLQFVYMFGRRHFDIAVRPTQLCEVIEKSSYKGVPVLSVHPSPVDELPSAHGQSIITDSRAFIISKPLLCEVLAENYRALGLVRAKAEQFSASSLSHEWRHTQSVRALPFESGLIDFEDALRKVLYSLSEIDALLFEAVHHPKHFSMTFYMNVMLSQENPFIAMSDPLGVRCNQLIGELLFKDSDAVFSQSTVAAQIASKKQEIEALLGVWSIPILRNELEQAVTRTFLYREFSRQTGKRGLQEFGSWLTEFFARMKKELVLLQGPELDSYLDSVNVASQRFLRLLG